MPKLSARPSAIGITVLALSLLVAALLAPAAVAAPGSEGSGSLKASPDPIVLAATTVGDQSPVQAISIGYEGEGEVWINKVTIEGAESGEFYLNNSSCSNLSDGQSCEAWVGLKPGSAGTKHALLVVHFSGERPPAEFEISGDGVEPALVIDPGEYDFGLQQVNRESLSASFQVENAGQAEVQIGNFEISGPGSEAFWVGSSDCWGEWLAPGQSCSVEVWFNPHDPTAYEAELRARANGSDFTADVSGRGGRAIVAATENPVDFGAAAVGSGGTVRTITLVNSGDVPESFFIAVIAGGSSASFKLLDENCSAEPLVPAASCSAHVRFAPESSGAKAARLALFGDGDGGVMVQLEGEGVAAAMTLAPGSFDFGSLAAGGKSSPHAFALRNDGSMPLDLDRVVIAGADLDQFVLAGDECTGAALAPGEECLVRVRFAPDEAGVKTATLRVSGPAGSRTAALSGTGAAAARPTGEYPGPPLSPAQSRGRHRFVRNQTIRARGGASVSRRRHAHSSGNHRAGKRAGKRRR